MKYLTSLLILLVGFAGCATSRLPAQQKNLNNSGKIRQSDPVFR